MALRAGWNWASNENPVCPCWGAVRVAKTALGAGVYGVWWMLDGVGRHWGRCWCRSLDERSRRPCLRGWRCQTASHAVLQELRYHVRPGLEAAKALDPVGHDFQEHLVLVGNDLVPRLGKGRQHLPVLGEVSVVVAGGLDGCPRCDHRVPQVSLQPLGALLDVAVDDVELVDPPLAVVALLARQEEVPFPAVGEDRHGPPVMEGVFEQLTGGPVALPNLLDLDEGNRLARRAAQGVVDASTAQGVFGPDGVGVVGRPTQGVKQPQDDALRDGGFVGEPARPDAGSDGLDLLFDSHGQSSAI